MRRKDREISDRKAIDRIIADCRVCRIALCDEGQPYVLPFNFGYDGDCIYVHTALEGRKMEILKRNDRVGFEFDILHEIVVADTSCGWTARFQSVIGTGRAELVRVQKEKSAALECILRHYGGVFTDVPEKAMDSVAVIRIRIESISGKERM
ncbi:MAG: pyridoxamine 5'-phosphate oxidase family protein [Deltaproteobacteria bacterium]|nr:pyridoxamine 5'-phosphate oxidase family protein [Deltaproteobacteria bacterium]